MFETNNKKSIEIYSCTGRTVSHVLSQIRFAHFLSSIACKHPPHKPRCRYQLGKHKVIMELENSSVQPATMSPVNFAATAQSPAGSQPVLGLIIPGGPVRTDFVQVDASGTKWSLTLNSPGDLPSPLTLVNELVCFLGAPLPPTHGLLLYWQLSYCDNNGTTTQEQQSGFELLGALTTDRPSEILRTGWSEHDQFLAIPPQQPARITIGVSIEPLDSVRNLVQNNNATGSVVRPLVAQKIAQDLYNFMQSFDTGGAVGNQQMVVPSNIFERWWKRFENKSKRDPNFFLKNSD